MLDRSISFVPEEARSPVLGGVWSVLKVWVGRLTNAIASPVRRLVSHPVINIAVTLVVATVVGMITVNTLYFQRARHPAPILVTQGLAPGKDLFSQAALNRSGPQPLPVKRVIPNRAGEITVSQPASPILVRNIQAELQKQGVYDEEAHGRLDKQTAMAIRLYQAASGLTVDGRASQPLFEHLLHANTKKHPRAFKPASRPASTPASQDPPTSRPAPAIVSKVQRALAVRGFSPGAIDGIWGEQTRKAIRAFEAASQFSPRGAIDALLLRRLNIEETSPAPAG